MHHSVFISPTRLWAFLGRFMHPLVYGEYPKTMQNIVGKRLPKFTKEEVKMVKGSFDFVGINQYTAYYMYDAHQENPKNLGYQQDWNVGFACKIISFNFVAAAFDFAHIFILSYYDSVLKF